MNKRLHFLLCVGIFGAIAAFTIFSWRGRTGMLIGLLGVALFGVVVVLLFVETWSLQPGKIRCVHSGYWLFFSLLALAAVCTGIMEAGDQSGWCYTSQYYLTGVCHNEGFPHFRLSLWIFLSVYICMFAIALQMYTSNKE